MSGIDQLHNHFMQIALNHAYRNIGLVAPNPAVGAVIVKEGRVISAAVTSKGGRPHAEPIAIANSSESVSGATLYVTLEPCCHHGKTPPCTDAIIKSGISKVVIAVSDPYVKVNGNGIEVLKQADIEVITHVLEDKATEINKAFFKVQSKKLPYVTLKMATSLDAKIATRNGESKWITSDLSRNFGHLMRAKNDAVLTGIGTVKADDPMLDCRLPGMAGNSPIRIVFDSKLSIKDSAKIITTADDIETYIVTLQDSNRFANSSVKVITAKQDGSSIDIEDALRKIASLGINSILVEAGAKVLTSFLAKDLVDEIIWFRAPIILGNDAVAAISDLSLDRLADAKRFKRYNNFNLSSDIVEQYKRVENAT